MKSIRFIFCLFAVFFSLPLSLSAKADAVFSFRCGSVILDENYRNNSASLSQLDEALSSGSLLRVTLRSYSSPDGSLAANKRISSKRAVTLRDEILSRGSDLTESSVKIIDGGEDWKGAERILRSMDYEWKDEALEIIRSSSENKKQLLQELYVGEAWEVLLKNVFPRLRRVEVSFIYALGEGDHEFELKFPVGIGWISENYSGNSAALNSLRSLAASSPDTIYIKSCASIDGSTSSNERLSEKRANSVRSFLVSEGYDASRIVVLNIGEDWEGFAEAVRSSDLDDKDEILEILEDTSSSGSQKKLKLKQLNGGRSWKRLLSATMPSLRRVLVQ